MPALFCHLISYTKLKIKLKIKIESIIINKLDSIRIKF
jgi:hypothetical protein